MAFIETQKYIINIDKILYIQIGSTSDDAPMVDIYFSDDKFVTLHNENNEAADFLQYMHEKQSARKIVEALDETWKLN